MKGYFLEEMMLLSKTFLKTLFPELLATTIIEHYQEIVSLIVHSIGDIEMCSYLLDRMTIKNRTFL